MGGTKIDRSSAKPIGIGFIVLGILLIMGGLQEYRYLLGGGTFWRLEDIGYIGILFFLIGCGFLALGLFAKPEKPVLNPSYQAPLIPPSQQTEYFACPNCNGPVKLDYLSCPHCGNAFRKKCPGCGQIVPNSWKVCAYCNNKFPEDTISTEPANKLRLG